MFIIIKLVPRLLDIYSLWSLQDISSCYKFNMVTHEIININTNKIKKVCIDKKGYPVLYLQRKTPTKNGRMMSSVKYHKIIALALINNGPYTLIEHLDDNPLNFKVSNLKFSDKCNNIRRMYKNCISNHTEQEFKLCMKNDIIYTGTIKELSMISGIPRGTLYDNLYKNNTLNSEHGVKSIEKLKDVENSDGFSTLEKISVK